MVEGGRFVSGEVVISEDYTGNSVIGRYVD